MSTFVFDDDNEGLERGVRPQLEGALDVGAGEGTPLERPPGKWIHVFDALPAFSRLAREVDDLEAGKEAMGLICTYALSLERSL